MLFISVQQQMKNELLKFVYLMMMMLVVVMMMKLYHYDGLHLLMVEYQVLMNLDY
jgi:hypothetical protein